MKVAKTGWIIQMRNSDWCRKLVPEMTWSMSEGSMSDFECWWWFDQSDVKVKSVCCDREEAEQIRGHRDTVAEWYWEFCKWEMILYSIHSETLWQWRDFRIGVMRWNFGACTSSSKSILDVLKTIHLIFQKTIVQIVTVVKLGVYDGGGNCFGRVKVKVGTDTAKSMDVMIADLDNVEIWSENERCSSNMKPRLREDWEVSTEVEELWIFETCRLSPIRRKSVLEELREKRLEVIKEMICVRAFWKWVMLAWKSEGWKARKSRVSSA